MDKKGCVFFIFVKIIVKRLIYSSFLLLILPYSSIQTNQTKTSLSSIIINCEWDFHKYGANCERKSAKYG